MVGRPVEELDRRQSIKTLLRTGRLPTKTPVVPERREVKQVLIPLWDMGELVGVVVLIVSSSELAKPNRPNLPRHLPSDKPGEPQWPARYTFADIIGSSPALGHARDLALQASQSGSSVLLLGESGTGKELFAQAIHAASSHRAAPFIPVDCASIPRELLEAELFGYAPGAFTGASKEGKAGKFELVNRGTIFLDEIGEMPLGMQAKLLRVLQERHIVRVGGVTPIAVAFTIIAATNRDLESLVVRGRFRRDLLYRLDVIRIEIPSLRERPEDIPRLVDHYWTEKTRELGKTATLSAEAMRILEGYSWPGNVRELVNIIERLLVGGTKPIIESADLPSHIQQEGAKAARRFHPFHLATVLAETERRTLERALWQARGNRNKAAQLLGVSRASLYRKAKLYGLLPDTCENDYALAYQKRR